MPDEKTTETTEFGDLTGLAALRTLNAQAEAMVGDLKKLGDAIFPNNSTVLLVEDENIKRVYRKSWCRSVCSSFKSITC
jgi:hypothetical protein